MGLESARLWQSSLKERRAATREHWRRGKKIPRDSEEGKEWRVRVAAKLMVAGTPWSSHSRLTDGDDANLGEQQRQPRINTRKIPYISKASFRGS